MKKVKVTLLCMLLIMAVLLTACAPKGSKNNEEETTSGETNKTTTEATTQEKPKVSLSWYIPGDGTKNLDSVLVKANELLEEKINANLKLEILDWGEYPTRMTTMMGAGEEFDLCFTANWMNDYGGNAMRGAFVDVGSMIDARPKVKDLVSEDFWSLLKINGKIYGVPNVQVAYTQEGIIFNKALVDKYKIDIDSIKSYADVTRVCQIIKDNEPDVSPATHMYPWFKDPGLQIIGPDTYIDTKNWKVVGIEALMDSLEAAREWNLKGFFPADIATNNDFEPIMKAGKFFMRYTTTKPGNAVEAANKYGYEFIDKPTGEKVFNIWSATATITAISVTSKNPERAMDLIELMGTDHDVFSTLAFGIEGQDYNRVPGTKNTIEKIPDTYVNAPWAIGNVFNGFALKGQPDDIHEQTQKENREAKISPLAGFEFNGESVETELLNIEAVQQQYAQIFEYGLADPQKTLAEYNEKMKAAGVEKYRNELQKQLDAWVAAKK